jgi:tetratricopeptide (TPR) repeat protein
MSGTETPDPAAPAMTWEQHHEAGRRRFAEGDATGAEQAFLAAVAQAEQPGGDPLQVASSLSSLGQLRYQQKDYVGAEDSFRRSLELRERALGSDHPTVISGINNLAALYVARGALDEAEPLLQRAMGVTLKRVEATQSELAVNLNNLVRLYVKRGDYARAEPLVVRLLALKRPLGPEHPDVAAVLVTLAKLRQSMGQSPAAERLWRRVLAVRQRTLAPNDPVLASTLDGLADSCAAQGKVEQELSLRERSLAVRTAAVGADHPSLEAHRARLAGLKQAMPVGRSASSTPATPTPTAPAAPVENGGPATGIANGVTGLTGVIPNVIPEALAITRAMNEATTPGKPTPTALTNSIQAEGASEFTGRRALHDPVSTPTASMQITSASGDAGITTDAASPPRPPGAPVPREAPTRPSPVPEIRRPTPIPELDTQAPDALPARASQAVAAVAPTPSSVKWIEPATVVPPPPRVRRSEELARPKVNIGAHAQSSAGGAGRTMAFAVAALIVVCAAAAGWYALRGRIGGGAPANAEAHHGAPAAVPQSTTPAPASATPPAPEPSSVTAAPTSEAAAAPGTSGTQTAWVPVNTPAQEHAAETQPVGEPAEASAKPVATPVRLPVAPTRAPTKSAPVHRRAATPAADTVPSIPDVTIDATHALDDPTGARRPSTNP